MTSAKPPTTFRRTRPAGPTNSARARISRLTLVAMLVAVLGVTPVAPSVAADVTLNRDVWVKGDTVLLSDVFRGVDPVLGRREVLRGVGPGGDGRVLSASWLKKTARDHGVRWSPSSEDALVRVRREGLAVTPDELAMILKDLYLEQENQRLAGAVFAEEGEDIRLILDSRTEALVIPKYGSVDVRLERMQKARFGDNFTAVLAVETDVGLQRVTLRGRVERLVSVPVVVRALARGDLIASDDLELRLVRASEAGHNAVQDLDDAVGLETKRSLRVGDVIQTAALKKPLLVRRRGPVVVQWITPGITVSLRMRAKEDGSLGDVIAVENLATKRIVDVVVTGPGEGELLAAQPSGAVVAR